MAAGTPLRIRFEAFELDEANARLTREGRPVSLPPKAFAVLCTLARNPGQLVTKNALLDAVWGHQHVSESLLKNIVSGIRAALSDDARSPRYIETASRFGYRFIGSTTAPTVTVVASNPAPAVSSTPEPAHRAPSHAAPSATVVGREAAIARIREVWKKTQAGERHLLWITGEAGVGKTTVLEAFTRELAPGVAAFGHCVEHFGTGEPYLPVLEVLRDLCRTEPHLPQLVRRIAPTWLIQLPWLLTEEERADLHRELAGAHPDRMLREIRELMEHCALKEPMVFVLEDMHWSDLSTLRMMEVFARRPDPVPILWIATFRLTQIVAENHPLRGLRQELKLHRLCEEIMLDPFSERDVASYLQARLPDQTFPDWFVQRVHAHTDGLPLFVANVVDSLAAQADKDANTIARWLSSQNAPLPVPDSLAGIVEKQSSRLSPEVQAMLEAASVCGADFRAGIVADMLNRDPQWVQDRCDELIRSQIWLRPLDIVELPDGEFDARYEFLHALYQHVFYNRLGASQRVNLHRRAARSLRAREPVDMKTPPAEIASHHERGHEFLLALRAYAEAAGLATAHFAPKDAVNLAEHALSLVKRCPANTERDEVELALVAQAGIASATLHGIASEEARTAFMRARTLCDRLPPTPSRAVTLNGLGWNYYVRGEFAEALALSDRLENISQAHQHTVLFIFACNLRGCALVNMGKPVEGVKWLERGIEKCRELPEDKLRTEFFIDPEVSMRLNVAFPCVNLGFADRGRTHLRLGRERAERLSQPASLMLAYWTGGMTEARLDNIEEVEGYARQLADVVEKAVIAQGRGPSLWLTGFAQARLGDARAGQAKIIEGYRCHADLGMYGGCTEVLGYAAEALMLANDWDGARKQVEDAFALSRQIGERVALVELFLLRARVEAHDGCFDLARQTLLEGVREAEDQQAYGVRLKALVALAELPAPHPDDLAALRAAVEAMTEGRDTKIFRRAKELLD